MDPVSQGALGAALSQSTVRREKLAAVAWFGALAGMAPDLDIFIQSPTDPLLFLVFHRQFTHALVFIPVGALLVAWPLYRLFRHPLTWRDAYLASLAGYATHGLLDACTTYGTQLFWPFSDARIAWNNVSVIDPLFTLPLLALAILAAHHDKPRLALIGLAWALFYLGIGEVQHQRAIGAAQLMIAERGHTPTRLSVKPGFANLLLWKVVYEQRGKYYVDAVRVAGGACIYPGEHVTKLDLPRHFPDLDPNSQQARDVERFRWFSADYLAIAKDGTIIDMRYSIVPNQIDALWGIRLLRHAEVREHVEWWSNRDTRSDQRDKLLRMLAGQNCKALIAPGRTPAAG
ncbi:MAG: metal-dependent hydrolase [Pseudomonadales bacterium]|jgi:inner membrane protein|nr:metal-dependent hydrolase [Pseudomonadales bacterium]MDP6472090.1 metal-dependent hydrolase [Pseudomonadales bacterium]MDP6826637.1 metal-dependent hydrolase [Pseudomonadales bacterium]MDP6970002.1 metal-dependent hydrolase [Pseudomonadales bacterium]